MASIIDQLGSTISGYSWAGMGNIAMVISVIFLVLIVFGGVWFLMWWKSYHINVKIYEPFGQVSPETLKKFYENQVEEGLKDVKFDMIRYKRTHGKFVTHKGTNFFSTFSPFKKHEPISMEFIFDDGVHLLKLSRDIYIPIPKPKIIIGVGENVSISVADNNKWIAWNNMMADRINNKYQDVEVQKRAIMYFVIGIVAMVLIGAFILWLIYSSTNKAYSAADKLSQFANSLGGAGAKTPA